MTNRIYYFYPGEKEKKEKTRKQKINKEKIREKGLLPVDKHVNAVGPSLQKQVNPLSELLYPQLPPESTQVLHRSSLPLHSNYLKYLQLNMFNKNLSSTSFQSIQL